MFFHYIYIYISTFKWLNNEVFVSLLLTLPSWTLFSQKTSEFVGFFSWEIFFPARVLWVEAESVARGKKYYPAPIFVFMAWLRSTKILSPLCEDALKINNTFSLLNNIYHYKKKHNSQYSLFPLLIQFTVIALSSSY